ncbi:MAG: hypothetical protein OQL06_03955 [Gammaproteobacteria bacterium]|nr:hypothetical protein [Gammaproteobacteria bacterium]
MFVAKILMIILLLFFAVKTHRAHNTEKHLIWKNENNWEMQTLSGVEQLQLDKNSFVSSMFTILVFQMSCRQKFVVLIFNDAIDKNQYRRLRVRLKVESAKLFGHARIKT